MFLFVFLFASVSATVINRDTVKAIASFNLQKIDNDGKPRPIYTFEVDKNYTTTTAKTNLPHFLFKSVDEKGCTDATCSFVSGYKGWKLSFVDDGHFFKKGDLSDGINAFKERKGTQETECNFKLTIKAKPGPTPGRTTRTAGGAVKTPRDLFRETNTKAQRRHTSNQLAANVMNAHPRSQKTQPGDFSRVRIPRVRRRQDGTAEERRRRLLASASRVGATSVSRDLLRRKGCLEVDSA